MHWTDLSAELQTALIRPVVPEIKVRCILDPDGINIDLSEYINRDSSINIRKGKQIFPYGDIGRFQIGEVSIDFINRNNYFDSKDKSSPFYYAVSRLYEAHDGTQTFIRVVKGQGSRFAADLFANMNDGQSSVRREIDNIDETPAKYDQINFKSAWTGDAYSFSGGQLVETDYMVGKTIVLKNYIEGVSTEIEQFRGILKALPQISDNGVKLTIYSNFKNLLDVSLKANTYRVFDDSVGNYHSTIEYQRVNESDGEISGIAISTGAPSTDLCKIGQWEIEFTTEIQDFIVTDPDGLTFNGNTSESFYAGVYPHFQIYIAAFAWTGTFDPGDKITFQTVCSLGRADFWSISAYNNYFTIPWMLKALLLETFAANLDVSEIVEENFDKLITDYDEFTGAISFKQPTTVLKAIELLQQHINSTIFHNNSGLFDIHAYRPQLIPDTVPELSPDADIRELDIEDLGKVERVWANYLFDHEEGGYQGKIIIPPLATEQGDKVELNFPAYTSADYGPARGASEHVAQMWRRGVRRFAVTEKWNYAIAFDINDIVKISSLYPQLAKTVVEVFEVEKDILNGVCRINNYDLDYSFGNYLFYDQHNWDSGRVFW